MTRGAILETEYINLAYLPTYNHKGCKQVGLKKLPKDTLLRTYLTAGDWDCVAAVERLPALHYSVDFIFLSYGIIGLLLNFEAI